MKAIDPTALVYASPVTLHKGEELKQLGYKQLGKAFQDSLQIKPSELGKERVCKAKKKYFLSEEKKKIRAEKAREKYKSITREEMDKRNENGRKGRKNRKAAK